MICNNCNKKDVCKHYDYLKRYDGLKLNECKYKTTNYNNINNNNDFLTKTKPNNIKTTTYFSNNDSNTNREYISNKIQEVNNSKLTKEEKNKDFKIVTTPTELVQCPTCGEKVYEEDLNVCDKCQKTMCSSCGTRAFDCNKEASINICDACWSNEKTSTNNTDNKVLKWREFLGKNIELDNSSK